MNAPDTSFAEPLPWGKMELIGSAKEATLEAPLLCFDVLCILLFLFFLLISLVICL